MDRTDPTQTLPSVGWLRPIVAAGLIACLGCGPAPEVEPAAARPSAITAAEGEPFVDVTAAAGIGFVHSFGDPTMDNIIESLGSGASWIDFDGDLDFDLYLVDQGWREGVSAGERPARAPANRLYENQGGGAFREVPGAAGAGDDGYGYGAAVGDVDNDGDADLLVANCGPNRLYVNRGDGTFRRAEGSGAEDGRCTAAATFLDYDRDGFLDLYLANYLTFDPEYTLHYAPDVFPGPMAYEPQPDALLRNRGDGVDGRVTFEDVSKPAGIAVDPGRAMGVVATDFDGDGWTDLFVANDATANFLFKNLGRGDGPVRGDGPSFEEVAALSGVAFGFRGEATGAMTGVVGDLDGDGRPDLLVTDTTYGSLYRNREDGLFEDLVMQSGLAAPSGQWVSWGGGFFDYDNDGDLDIFQVNGDLKRMTGRPDLLLANRGDGSFDLAEGGAYFRAELLGRGGSFADFDDDGDVDVVVTVLGGSPVLLRNDAAAGAHWLGVVLRGADSNRDGLGAVVTVRAGDREWVRIRHAPAGYLTHDDPRLHFGLGEFDRIDRLEVRWPSGKLDTLEDLGVDRYLAIEEGKGAS